MRNACCTSTSICLKQPTASRHVDASPILAVAGPTTQYIQNFCTKKPIRVRRVEKMEREEESTGEGCVTPKHGVYRIPKELICPPPPKKKTAVGKRMDPPKNGYFQPPDLEVLFSLVPRQREACA
ncbi:cyclin-dependent protein kinase inhibitor SMR4-like [Magnolia sinica]|uniref:cyclin-dependent protein kinase inhibitor SMR4-like n=1 Tax=Magnolia sinica TaxID=86752 RepID=UPI002658FE12|nr:cyclin-dependent protein kinase inhibitor SMR4-like [Magnolia sinica]